MRHYHLVNGFKSVLLAFVLIMFVSAPCMAQSADFPDVRGHWAEPFITLLAEKGSVSGMPDGLFHPDDIMTLPQFVSIIITAEFGPQPPVTDHWASGYMQLALEKGVIADGDMETTGGFTRFDAARLVFNSLVTVFEEEEENNIMLEPDFIDFTDCRSCQTGYAYARQCHVKGIISGRPSPDGAVFDGSGGLTRAEGCTILMKMLSPDLRTPLMHTTGETD